MQLGSISGGLLGLSPFVWGFCGNYNTFVGTAIILQELQLRSLRVKKVNFWEGSEGSGSQPRQCSSESQVAAMAKEIEHFVQVDDILLET